VRVVTGLGDTVYHTLMARPECLDPRSGPDREFLGGYEGPLCISPRYERLVTAVLGTDALADVEFVYPDADEEEEAAIAAAGVGVYLTVTGSTAREHGLVVGEHLFPSETVLMQNAAERDPDVERALAVLDADDATSEIRV
jgi:ATP phosphoribosyltransferase